MYSVTEDLVVAFCALSIIDTQHIKVVSLFLVICKAKDTQLA